MRRLRSEAGMTLMEVLSAATVGFVVLAGVLGLLESSVRLNTGVMAKTDAMQRGRLAMDRVTQQLRSEVCLDLDHPAILANATANSVTFYADFSNASGLTQPQKRTLALDPATGKITSLIYRTAVAPPAKPLPTDYPATTTSGELVLENTTLQKTPAGVDIPFLKYFAYQQVGVPPHPEATMPLPVPLDDAEAARVARIEIAFTARPTGAKDSKNAVAITDQIAVRHADPNLAVPDPACV
jgi:hypothetical protein